MPYQLFMQESEKLFYLEEDVRVELNGAMYELSKGTILPFSREPAEVIYNSHADTYDTGTIPFQDPVLGITVFLKKVNLKTIH